MVLTTCGGIKVKQKLVINCIFVLLLVVIMEILTDVGNIKFDIEVALDEQYGALPLPFAGMDSKLMFRFLVMRLCLL